MPSAKKWDIFCNIVDNFGDIGVCWRLARQLAAEHSLAVRLWVDQPESLQKICPEFDPALDAQSVRGVEVRHWAKPFAAAEPADVVIEAFGCKLPESYVAAMAARASKPAWINLEYLCAEDWILGCHRLPSPHPRLPLIKHFFFPGFVDGTGGLLAERELARRRREFQQDPHAIAAFWQSLGLPAPRPEELRVSLFCYGDQPVSELLDAWAGGAHPVLCLVAEGLVQAELGAFFNTPETVPGSVLRKGKLEVRVMPFIEQDRYDRLLWACDCNFVRGEDSFVRAQWAAKPMIWQIYPQEEGVHLEKLRAFLDHYCAGLPEDASAAVRALWQAWNRGEGAGSAWGEFWRQRAVLEAHARRWADDLPVPGDLASNLVHFCDNLIK